MVRSQGGDPVAMQRRDSRVLVLSQRRLDRPLWHATQFEMEDVVAGIDDVLLLTPPPGRWSEASRPARRLSDGARRRLRQPRRTPPPYAPTMLRTPVETDHDLFFAVFHYSHELTYLNSLPGWGQRCRAAACLLVEQWSTLAEADADYLQTLREFDRVYLFNPATADRLARLGVQGARFLPTAVDMLRFAPPARPPARVVDVYSFGRTSPVTHRALRDLVETTGLTYLFDTTAGGRLLDPGDHRALMASLMQRSRYFLAWTINDSPERRKRTGGDEALSTRYFEGAAGGAVLLGSRPVTPEFDECFGWQDAVLPVPYDCPDISEVLRDLDAQPERMARIRANNIRNSLARHDWAHRWRRVLSDMGLAELPQLGERLAALEERAACGQGESSSHGTSPWVDATSRP